MTGTTVIQVVILILTISRYYGIKAFNQLYPLAFTRDLEQRQR
jgi:hypothetical protein